MPRDSVLDTDPDETQEWLDSIDALATSSTQRGDTASTPMSQDPSK